MSVGYGPGNSVLVYSPVHVFRVASRVTFFTAERRYPITVRLPRVGLRRDKHAGLDPILFALALAHVG